MKQKAKKEASPNLSKINWDKEDPNMTSVYDKRKLMIITTSCYFVYF